MKERINYSIEHGIYVANAANLPFIIQADSFEDMEYNAYELLRIYIVHLQKVIDEKNFEFVEQESLHAYLLNTEEKKADENNHIPPSSPH